MTIYISKSIKFADANFIIEKLKNKYKIGLGNIYITNTSEDGNKAKDSFFKIILIADNSEQAARFEFCSITCEKAKDVVDYLLRPNFNSGLSYLFDGNSGMPKLDLHKKLSSWDIKYGNPSFVDYIRLEPGETGRYNKELCKINCILRNFVNLDSIIKIVNKKNLYDTMKDAYPDYLTFMPETFPLDEVQNVFEGDVFIVKPVGSGASSSKGISIVTNNQELAQAKKDAKLNQKWDWIISRYIKNPLLFNGLKFHFRCYLMVTSTNKFYKFHYYQIIPAIEKYKASDFANKNIHDSQGNNIPGSDTYPNEFTYPYDLSDKRIQVEVERVMERIIHVLKTNPIRGYDESKYSYEILGMDILFDESYHAWLLEVNTKIGHYNFKNFAKAYLSWEFNSIVKPIFSQIELIPLEMVNEQMLEELLILTTNKEIMAHIGRGELWNREKILKMINESKQHSLINASHPRNYFNWVVRSKYGRQKIVGFVGLIPMFKGIHNEVGINDLRLRLITYSQGYGLAILKKLKKYVDQTNYNIWILIHVDNKFPISMTKKLGAEFMGDTVIGDRVNSLFRYKSIKNL